MLRISDISFRYPHSKDYTLSHLNLSLRKGNIYGLLGKNGAGKSTLLYLTAGLLSPLTGQVLFHGQDTRRRIPALLADMFIVPEEFELPEISLSEYVKLNAPFYPRFSREEMERHLVTFEMDPSLNLGRVSMGQKKKAFMCFALACNTSLLLMDEPTNGLDIPGKAQFRRFIASAMSDERTVLISTHQVKDIERLLDHVLILEDGKIALDASVNDITDKLSFRTTCDKREAEEAYFVQPSLGGFEIVTEALPDYPTEINLETLFELAISRPEIINRLFNPSQS